MAIVYGANPEEWDHFDFILGLGKDLLPVVSNPNAVISPLSNLVDIGKVPSLYNRAGEVGGIKDWTSKETSPAEIERYLTNPDYGICIQTRRVRAIDVDVDDAVVADKIEAYLQSALGKLPVRRRSNSGKRLFMFEMIGTYGKRKIEVEGGIIEILMNGQQFIAVGTHPSGVRYEWDGGLPDVVPVVSEDAFEALWSGLVDRFGVDKGSVTEYKERSRGLTVVKDDPVADYLRDEGLVLSVGSLGELRIECPWKHEHSDGGVGGAAAAGTSTIWMVNGSNGHDAGHFKCLHAHCSGRTDDEFIEKIGAGAVVDQVIVDMFPVVVSAGGAGDDSSAFVNLLRDKKGAIEAIIGNAVKAVGSVSFCGIKVAYDQFKDEVVYALSGEEKGQEQWIPFRDEDYVRLRLSLESKGFKPVPKEMIRDVVHYVASQHAFDSAIEWISRLVWDGEERIERFMHEYLGCEKSDYAVALGEYLWTALAGRVLVPGIKADMMPIFIGEQGAGKSSAVMAIAPHVDLHCEISLMGEKDADVSRRMRGRLVAEIAELKGMKTRDVEHTKAFISRQYEDWVPKFQEYAKQVPRRVIFIGTTNEDEFLNDRTGNRRMLPIKTGVVKPIDVSRIEQDRLQLWAEGAVKFKSSGISYAYAEKLGRDVHSDHMVTDPWEYAIDEWLVTPNGLTGEVPAVDGFKMDDLLRGALKIETRSLNTFDEVRARGVLKGLGYVTRVVKRDGKAVRKWIKSS